MHIKNKRGQSTVEYILLVTAVIAVIIVFLSSSNQNGFQSQYNAVLNSATGDMGTMENKLIAAHVSVPGGAGTPTYNVDVNPGG
jgi:uncharacterized protein (UPF0333 family)